MVYNDEISPFKELLGKVRSETMYQRNIKIFAAELFKIKNNLEICKLQLKSFAIICSEIMKYSSW